MSHTGVLSLSQLYQILTHWFVTLLLTDIHLSSIYLHTVENWMMFFPLGAGSVCRVFRMGERPSLVPLCGIGLDVWFFKDNYFRMHLCGFIFFLAWLHGCLFSRYSSLSPLCGTLGLARCFFDMLSGRDILCLWGCPHELWVRQNRTGPLLLQRPAGQGAVPSDGSTVSFCRSARWGQMDTLQKDCKQVILFCAQINIKCTLLTTLNHHKLSTGVHRLCDDSTHNAQLLKRFLVQNSLQFQEFALHFQ